MLIGEQDLRGLDLQPHLADRRGDFAAVPGRRRPGGWVDVKVGFEQALLDPAHSARCLTASKPTAPMRSTVFTAVPVVELEGLQEPRHLHVFPAARLDHAHLRLAGTGL